MGDAYSQWGTDDSFTENELDFLPATQDLSAGSRAHGGSEITIEGVTHIHNVMNEADDDGFSENELDFLPATQTFNAGTHAHKGSESTIEPVAFMTEADDIAATFSPTDDCRERASAPPHKRRRAALVEPDVLSEEHRERNHLLQLLQAVRAARGGGYAPFAFSTPNPFCASRFHGHATA